MEPLRQWQRDEFLVSIDANLFQLSAINAAFASDLIYWTKAMSEEALKKMISKSLCFGVYNISNHKAPVQVGFGRLITDEVTFAYLTDVYILPEYQGRGLGTWLMSCISETLQSWPELRRAMLITSGEAAKAFYKKLLQMEPFPQGLNGVEILNKKGSGSVMRF